MSLIMVKRESGIPLLGSIYFGIIDRGTNILQVRASTACNLNCIFCSVDGGSSSKIRKNDFVVEYEYLADWIREAVKYKERDDIEVHLDSVGEPMMYPQMAELVREIRAIKEVKTISMQSNGMLLTKEKIDVLSEAGLDRINLSINSLDPIKAQIIAGCPAYDIDVVTSAAKAIMESNIQLMLTPVYMPGINDKDIEDIIQFGISISTAHKKVHFGIQKFLKYKHGRRPKGLKEQTWEEFYDITMAGWEKKFDISLRLAPENFKIVKCKAVPTKMKVGERVEAEIVADGWMVGEKLAVAENRTISILNCRKEKGKIKVKIVSNKHGIYLGK